MYASCIFEQSEDAITWEKLPIKEVFIFAHTLWMKLSEDRIVQVKKNQEGNIVACGESVKLDPSWDLRLSKISK